jgi:hypothetical protein
VAVVSPPLVLNVSAVEALLSFAGGSLFGAEVVLVFLSSLAMSFQERLVRSPL